MRKKIFSKHRCNIKVVFRAEDSYSSIIRQITSLAGDFNSHFSKWDMWRGNKHMERFSIVLMRQTPTTPLISHCNMYSLESANILKMITSSVGEDVEWVVMSDSRGPLCDPPWPNREPGFGKDYRSISVIPVKTSSYSVREREGERERAFIQWFTPHMATMASAGPAWNQMLHEDFPRT